MPGVIIVSNGLPFGRAIDDLLIVGECSQEGEWKNRVLYLPIS
jgi:hypothetical protein